MIVTLLSILGALLAFLLGRKSGAAFVQNPETHKTLETSLKTSLDAQIDRAKEKANEVSDSNGGAELTKFLKERL